MMVPHCNRVAYCTIADELMHIFAVVKCKYGTSDA